MYVFDTNSLQQLFSYPQKRFPSLWKAFDELLRAGKILSVKEVSKEIIKPEALVEWCKVNSGLFPPATEDEGLFLQQIYKIEQFQVIGSRILSSNSPFADPFIIAKAKCVEGTVVSEEKHKPDSARIPTICKRFGINCTNLEGFMEAEGWQF